MLEYDHSGPLTLSLFSSGARKRLPKDQLSSHIDEAHGEIALDIVLHGVPSSEFF